MNITNDSGDKMSNSETKTDITWDWNTLTRYAGICGKIRIMTILDRADLYDPCAEILFSCRAPIRIVMPAYRVYFGKSKADRAFDIVARGILGYDNYYHVKDNQKNTIGGLQGLPIPALRTRRKSWEIFNSANVLVGQIADRTLENIKTYARGLMELHYVVEDSRDAKVAEIFSDYHLLWKTFMNFRIRFFEVADLKIDPRLVLAGVFMVMMRTR